ncbi:hypothetical protein RF11_14339 [Thelohanellus kitauei]|uniref:Uncharacterized protein n=1 Tax=Thelohanellus kitauei TaxID=669202 RepID=A0A0C2MK80_THEKT|nr:hypothetical protein RF11_14339 [Thelohanellus kitauei]
MDRRENALDIFEKKFLMDYIQAVLSVDINIQINVVKDFMLRFALNDNSYVDNIFIRHFPMELLFKIHSTVLGLTDIHNKTDMEILLFNIFTFIYRNRNLLTDSTAHGIIIIIVEYIKNIGRLSFLYPKGLMDSIINCVSNENNKILFISENAVLNFYFAFMPIKFSHKFWKVCETVYNIDSNCIVSFSHDKLQDKTDEIMNRCYTTSEECAVLLFEYFQMLYRFGWLNVVEFSIDKLYVMTNMILLRHIDKPEKFYPKYLINLSKIWTGILNEASNKIIDSIDKLAIFAAIFSIHLSKKLQKLCISGKFMATKNIKLRYYIIYFTLVSSPVIDHESKPWLRKVLWDLNNSLQMFIEKKNIRYLKTSDQFLLYQFYVKCHDALYLKIPTRDYDLLDVFCGKLENIRSLSKIY